MINEEAIKMIEVAIAEVEWNYPMDYAIAFETAISALEKQIPKKPLHWDDCEQFYIECPCCGKRYDSRLGYKGCPYCFQAIRLE